MPPDDDSTSSAEMERFQRFQRFRKAQENREVKEQTLLANLKKGKARFFDDAF